MKDLIFGVLAVVIFFLCLYGVMLAGVGLGLH